MKREGQTFRGLVPSGVALFDDWLGGLRDGAAHLLTGGPGCGKSSIALHFADAGLRRGESVAMLVHGRADDIKSHARHLGVNLESALRDGRLVLLRYRSDFVHLLAQAVSPEQVISDLEALITPHAPSRVVIDTLSPFVSGGLPAGAVVIALMDLLDRMGASSLLTFPEDLSAGYDRSLEPLVQGSAAVLQLIREGVEVRRAELLNSRFTAPAVPTRRFVVRAGAGVVAEHPARADHLMLRAP